MNKIINDLRILKAFKKYGLIFDKEFKYYIGNAYKTKTNLSTDLIFKHNNKNYKLKYFSGCFNPYLILIE